jgi:hypothetical protein
MARGLLVIDDRWLMGLVPSRCRRIWIPAQSAQPSVYLHDQRFVDLSSGVVIAGSTGLSER